MNVFAFSSVLPALFTFLLVLALILAGKVYFKAVFPRLKGFIGERKTRKALEALPEDHIVLHDLLLQNGDKTSQIDHVVISPQGIFIIETKAYDGWIFGSEKAEYWTQVMGKKKQRFYNPVRQNRSHVQALKNTLARYGDPLYVPVVVFSDACELRRVDTTTTPVIHRKELVDFILNFKKDGILAPADIRDIYDRLVSANVRSTEARKQHVRYARTREERLRKRLSLRSQESRGGTV
jgi:hypothetical protein